jgi:hypothetical protein
MQGAQPEPPKPPAEPPKPTAQEPKPPQPPADQKSQAKVDPDEIERPKDASHWRALKSKYAQQLQEKEAEIQGLRRQLETLPKDLPNLLKERDELKTTLAKLSIEHDPEVKLRFDSRQEALKRDLQNLLGDLAEQALQLPPGRARNKWLSENASDLDELSRQQVAAALLSLDALQQERKAWIDEKARNFDAFVRERRQLETQALEQARASRLEAFQNSAERFAEEHGVPLFKFRDNDPEWNSMVRDLEMTSRRYIERDWSPEDYANAARWMAAGPKMRDTIVALGEEVNELKAALEKYRKGQPKGGEATPPASNNEDLSKLTFGELMLRRLEQSRST